MTLLVMLHLVFVMEGLYVTRAVSSNTLLQFDVPRAQSELYLKIIVIDWHKGHHQHCCQQHRAKSPLVF